MHLATSRARVVWGTHPRVGCRTQVVWTTLVADLETPVSAMMKLADGRANAFLLESVEGGAVRGRYSIIGTVVKKRSSSSR